MNIPERWKGHTPKADTMTLPDVLLRDEAWRLPALVEALRDFLEQIEGDPGVQIDGELILKAEKILEDIERGPQ